jgi:hypothetical protein
MFGITKLIAVQIGTSPAIAIAPNVIRAAATQTGAHVLMAKAPNQKENSNEFTYVFRKAN